MKKIRLLIFAAFAASAVSCSGFLDSFPSYAVDTSVSVTDSVAIALTNGCYNPLQSSNLYNMRVWSLDIIAGNSEVGGGGGDDGIETIQCANFAADASNAFALYIWRSPWVGIGQCNTVIRSLTGEGDQTSESIRNRCLGEAYFLRAHYYYLLVRLFGGVPLLLEPHDADDPTDVARASLSDCYAQIISDCQEAISLLPVKSSYSGSDYNRVCREAALCMLADIYLTWQPESHYAEVVTLCDQITSLGYDLTQYDFDENFGINADWSREALFTVGYSGSTQYDFWGADNQASWLSTYMGPRNSGMVAGAYGWNQPTEEFMGQWEEGDLRKDITVLYEGCPSFDGYTYSSSWSNTGCNVRKFLVSHSDSPEYNTNPADFVIYRYADVLLKKAEALNEQGQTEQACEPLNIVRNRAGLPDIETLMTAEMRADMNTAEGQEWMREKIIHERRMELAFEGHRWFDMIRINDGEYALEFLRSIGKNVSKERLLFPIPLTEMDSNNLMTQNPGY